MQSLVFKLRGMLKRDHAGVDMDWLHSSHEPDELEVDGEAAAGGGVRELIRQHQQAVLTALQCVAHASEQQPGSLSLQWTRLTGGH